MTNKKTTRALLLAVVALILCASMLVGATFAWFTESVSSVNNIIKPGNLDVEVEYSTDLKDWKAFGEQSNVFDQNALWEPGYTEVVYFRVKNEGSLALKYWLDVEVADETPSTNVNGEEFYLSNFIKYGVEPLGKFLPTVFADRDAAHAAVVADAQWINSPYVGTKATSLEAEEMDYFALVAYMPQTVGNDANHAKDADAPSIELGITFRATQYTVEEDSFDEMYDELADKLDVIFAYGGKVTFNEDFYNDRDALIVGSDADVVVDLEGNKLSADPIPGYDTFLHVDGSLLLNGADKDGNKGTVAFDGMALEIAGKATVNDVTLDAGNAANYAAAAIAEDAELVLNNVDIPSAGGAIAAGNGGKVIFNSGNVSIDCASTSGRYLFYAEDAGSEIVINGGTFDISADITMRRSYICALDGTKVTVNGGTFGKASTHKNYKAVPFKTEGTGEIIVKGGTFGFDPTKWVADGYTAIKEGSVWTVVPATAGALVDALVNGTASEVKLPAGVDFGTVTLDGTVKDKTIVGTGTDQIKINIGSTAVLENVTIQGLGVTYFDNSSSYVDGGAINIDAGATVKNLVIEGCTFNGSGGRSSAVGISEPSAEVTLKGCTVNGPKYTVYSSAPIAKLDIVDCNITGVSSWLVMMNAGDSVGAKLTITGNTFDNCNGGIAKYLGSSQPDGAFTVFTDNTLTSCVGHDGSDAKWFTIPGATATITVSGNTLDGADFVPGTAQGLGK